MRALRFVLLFALFARAIAAQTKSNAANVTTITFVANAENLTKPRARYTGAAWTADQGGFLAGAGRGHRLLAEMAPGAGDFRAHLDLALARAGRESAVIVGADGELSVASAAPTWTLRGRFFRAADEPITFAAPSIKPGQAFSLAIERKGAQVTISVNAAVVYRGECNEGALSELGIDPGAGAVQLYTLSATGVFSSASAPAKAFGNPFGMQLRPAPVSAGAAWAPAIVREAPTNECSIVARHDGALEIYFITKPESDSVSVIRSDDGGLTWSKPVVAFRLPGRAYYAVVVLEATEGALHAVYHILGDGPGGYRGRLYEVYHTRRAAGGATWSEARRVVPGYVGSINGFIQHRGGRLLLAVARAVPEREAPPKTGPDRGWHDTFVYLSDDQGATWRESPDRLSLELTTANVTRYGAIEPTLLELRDGRVWMLVRDRGGRLWQSFSADGERWSALVRSPFISSDSPADLLRLHNGKIVLLTNACQNWSEPRSYAMGGREVLHAAISADDGKTWRGFREILHETNAVSGGDRGTSYASVAETADGKLVVVSGQGEGKRAIVILDPRWLEETDTQNDLTLGPVEWTQYGDEGVRVEEGEGGSRSIALPVKASGLCGALWNFPIGDSGEITMRLQVPSAVTALRLCLNDHFNRIDDRQAASHAVFEMNCEKVGPKPDARWHDVTLRWRKAQQAGVLEIDIDGQRRDAIQAQRAAQFGVNYLRVEFRGSADEGRVLIAGATMRAIP